ncbi:MAG: hypothetical protein IJH08_10220 [Atopobiaceae bacterium]|nr:hypothetical protein [Atopobiaceae bacterium]
MKQLRLTIGDVVLNADLLVDEAPITCAAIEELGPFASALFAANVCYGEFTFSVPLPDLMAAENVQPDTKPGQVSWYPDWQCVCVFTQEMEQWGPTPKFAQIREEDLPAFQELAGELWHQQGIPVIVEVVEEGTEASATKAVGWRGFSQENVPEGARDVLAHLEREVTALWTNRPEELSQMVARNATTGREAAVWAYAWGEIVNLGDMLISISNLAREGRGDAATLALVAAEQCRFFAGAFSGTHHMPKAAETLRKSADALECATTYEELLAVLRPVQVWCNQMHFWTSAELPWDSVSDVVHIEWNPEYPDPNWPDDLDLNEEDIVFVLDGDELNAVEGDDFDVDDLRALDGVEDEDLALEEADKKPKKKSKKKAKKDKAEKKAGKKAKKDKKKTKKK